MSSKLEVIEIKEVDASIAKLPRQIKILYTRQLAILRDGTKDHRLHLKKLRGLEEVFSFRITRSYRALFYFQNPNQVIIFAVGNRRDIYR